MLEAARPISYKRERFRESCVRDLGFIGQSKMFPLMFLSLTTFFLPSNLVSEGKELVKEVMKVGKHQR